MYQYEIIFRFTSSRSSSSVESGTAHSSSVESGTACSSSVESGTHRSTTSHSGSGGDRGSRALVWLGAVMDTFALAAVPQFSNQEPPRPQQLLLPDFAMIPHLGHAALIVIAVVVVTAGVHMWHRRINTKMKRRKQSLHDLSLRLTAGLDALKPAVISVPFVVTSTFLKYFKKNC